QSHMSRTLWRFLDRNSLPSEHIEAKVMEFLRKGVLTKRQTINGQGQELVTTELNFTHPLVIQALSASDTDEDDQVPDDMEEGNLNGSDSPQSPIDGGRRKYQRRFAATAGARRGRQGLIA